MKNIKKKMIRKFDLNLFFNFQNDRNEIKKTNKIIDNCISLNNSIFFLFRIKGLYFELKETTNETSSVSIDNFLKSYETFLKCIPSSK